MAVKINNGGSDGPISQLKKTRGTQKKKAAGAAEQTERLKTGSQKAKEINAPDAPRKGGLTAGIAKTNSVAESGKGGLKTMFA